MGKQPRQPGMRGQDVVKAFCDTHAVIRYDRSVTFKGRPSSLKLLRGQLLLHVDDSGAGLPENVVNAAFDDYLHELDLKLVKEYADRLAFDPAADGAALEQWLTAVSDAAPGSTEFTHHLAVMKHFIWQVKRKLNNLPVTYHLMPILYGRTGSGKSVAVERLLAPLSELVEAGRDFTIFNDSREWQVFQRMFVVAFDEMARAQNTDLNGMKKIITASTISYRELGTHNMVSGRMAATFFGTSNLPVNEVILDSTSARRFWQIKTRDKCDWETVNKIDYNALWRAVDEHAAVPPISPYWDAIQHVQHTELRHRSAVEEWFNDGYVVDPAGESKASDLFQAFRDWAELNNQGKLISSTKFGLELSRIDGVQKEHTAHGRVYRVAPKKAGAPTPNMGKVLSAVERLPGTKSDQP